MSAWDDLLDEQRQAALDDLLSRWHEWQHGARLARGYSSRSATCADYQSPASYNGQEDADEAIDERNEHATMKTMQSCVDAMAHELRPACYMLGRNAAVGVAVFRMRVEQLITSETLARARRELLERLISAGVID